MLGSVANNLFWMARYLERSENSSRLLELGIRRNLSERDNSAGVWEEILSLLGQKSFYDGSGHDYDQRSVTNFILRDKENTTSVWSLVNQSRENARTVRGSLTRQVWQAINGLWLYLQTALKSPVGSNDLPIILAKIQQGNALMRGALEGIARNPNASDKIFTPMIIGLALIESLVIYGLVIAFILQGKI